MNNNQIISNKAKGGFLQSFYKTAHAFSLTEKVVFFALLIIVVLTGLSLLSRINNKFLVSVPDYGGAFTEGIVGVPRFVNPVLAISDADKDLVSLVFAGLLKATPGGKLVNDLAESHEISTDGRTYTFTLRDDIFFHDGTRITTDDVEFTIQRIQDPTVKSPKRAVWDTISIQKMDSRRISFTLKQPYGPFLDNFTVGIIPHHIWKDIPSDEFSFSELNVSAVGSGPYEIRKVKRNSYGLPNMYTLRSFSDYSLGKAFVRDISLNFYQAEEDLFDAFVNDEIDSMSGVSPANIARYQIPQERIITTPLPRVFGVFFNQNQAGVFLNREVREALSVAINKDRIVDDVLFGHGSIINSPIPLSGNKNATSSASASASTTASTSNVDRAISILTKAGWTLNERTGIMEKKVGTKVTTLAFSLSTGDASELKRTAEFIKEDWEKIGASVDLKVFEIGDLNQNVIRPRKFDALLFGEVVGREYDLYPFWHSSQRNDPGLNIALYTNAAADKILETIRLTQNRDERMKKAIEFETMFGKDLPAAFIYSPQFIYVIPEKLQNVTLDELAQPSERFLNAHEWFIETNKVWRVFTY